MHRHSHTKPTYPCGHQQPIPSPPHPHPNLQSSIPPNPPTNHFTTPHSSTQPTHHHNAALPRLPIHHPLNTHKDQDPHQRLRPPPPGRLSTIVWTLGVGLLHSGVVINDREYAFGGHDRRGLTGVYWTKPRTVPPGGTFRTEILHGFTYASEDEINEIIREASNEFLGPSYNLLTRNCNHFTSHLCMALTGQPAPAYLNRAASIGVALPCVVPAGWVEPPECDLDGDDDDDDEQARLTSNAGGGGRNRRHSIGDEDAWGDGSSSDEEGVGGVERRSGVVRDAGGRQLPAAERARVDRTVR
ncbi:uncharacterized protein LAJ45_07305 [Morchella importuna]|uniref:uncharacterized protein n=1 Tax=Morchella importuna TaxID=1174673 RepID=UPI001E8E6DAA|nr:uncharacterized protein LAJ45_07305 [Morchella importuna]KAH8148594.1 hypothetical protein LAJ45_07305 [Morchella importuna]